MAKVAKRGIVVSPTHNSASSRPPGGFARAAWGQVNFFGWLVGATVEVADDGLSGCDRGGGVDDDGFGCAAVGGGVAVFGDVIETVE